MHSAYFSNLFVWIVAVAVTAGLFKNKIDAYFFSNTKIQVEKFLQENCSINENFQKGKLGALQ